ncbi:MAG TPA: hypothetical protein VNH17_16575, partial [Streptosporangiaceae bacterium]|nr:hypothetical protein [Streptosporangiaceae bacterium]
GITADGEVDKRAQAQQLVGVDRVAARPHNLHDLTGIDEHHHFVGVDDRMREATNRDIGPLEDDLALLVIRYRDEFPREQCHRRNDTAKDKVKPYHRRTAMFSCRGSNPVRVVSGTESARNHHMYDMRCAA